MATDEREEGLVAGLRAGEEDAYRDLVTRHHASLVRLASTFVPSRAVAEEVVQEAWVAVIEGIDRFEGRSSVKTWLFRILVNRARTRGARERRTVPFSSLDGVAPMSHDAPVDRVTQHETREVVDHAVRELPERQRQVITLRDLEGWTSKEVCTLLALSEGNQRVLLHRARSRVRPTLERYVSG